ncbi:hypothetical protein NE865_14114 [Phthorimaea operculella]|nr:hypothetical protein NE865_14114 [Phthorimaea operculella]
MSDHGANRCALQKVAVVIYFLIALTDSVKIEKIIVPEVIQSGTSSGAILDCIYSNVSNQFTLQWLFNDQQPPVYEWSPRKSPKVSGILDGRLDLTYRPSVSDSLSEQRRALRIVSLGPELSGNYTCRILDQGKEARLNKSMLVFSPEQDITLEFRRKSWEVDIICTASGVYPQPELVLELNSAIIAKQQLRLWRNEGILFDAESTAALNYPPASRDRVDQITCRLHIPQAGYTAIKKELIYLGQECGNGSSKISTLHLLFVSLAIVVKHSCCS